MTPGDRERFAELGITAVYDLRSDEERERLPDPIESIHVSLVSRMIQHGPPPDFAAMIAHDDGVALMRQLYSGLLAHAGPDMGIVLRRIAAGDGATLFHCTAGKDRTGMLAALLLELVGVDREHVLDDFELTERYHHPDQAAETAARMMARGVSPEAAAGALRAPRESMASALAELDDVYGGAERYVLEHAGLDHTTVAQLRTLLVDR
jgi:protein-tyrosine phosphatase